MKYRVATVWPRTSYATDKTEIIDLDLVDSVSQLIVMWEAVNTNTNPPTGHPDRCITKIELVDGSDVLYSLNGREAKAADWYHNKQDSGSLMFYPNNINAEMIYKMNFGRYLYDPELGLDPARFRNLQLKVSFDIDGGGAAPDAGLLTVLAHVFDEQAPAFKGFLMHKEFKSYVLVASAHEYTDLPTDYPYRKLLIGSRSESAGADYQFGNIKLAEDMDKKVYLNNSIGDVLRGLVAAGPPYQEMILDQPAWVGGIAGYCTPTYWPLATISEWLNPPTAVSLAVWGGDGGAYTKWSSSGWTSNVIINMKAYLPHGFLEIPFGRQDVIEDWFDPTRVKTLKLDVTAGASCVASSTCQLVGQQMRRY